jgi:hypothetical protein
MVTRCMRVLAVVAGLTIPSAALAQPASLTSSSPDSASVVQRLQAQERTDEFKEKFWSQEPLIQQDYDVQEQQDQQLVARVSAGQPVSTDELNQALQRVDTAY